MMKYLGIRNLPQCSFNSDLYMEDWSLKKILHHITCSGIYLEDWELRKMNCLSSEHQKNLSVKLIPQNLKHRGTKDIPVCTTNTKLYLDTNTEALSVTPALSHQYSDSPDGVVKSACVCVASRKTLKGMMMETTAALLLLLLLLTSPVNGKFYIKYFVLLKFLNDLITFRRHDNMVLFSQQNSLYQHRIT